MRKQKNQNRRALVISAAAAILITVIGLGTSRQSAEAQTAANGRIAFITGGVLHTMNGDGSNVTQVMQSGPRGAFFTIPFDTTPTRQRGGSSSCAHMTPGCGSYQSLTPTKTRTGNAKTFGKRNLWMYLSRPVDLHIRL